MTFIMGSLALQMAIKAVQDDEMEMIRLDSSFNAYKNQMLNKQMAISNYKMSCAVQLSSLLNGSGSGNKDAIAQAAAQQSSIFSQIENALKEELAQVEAAKEQKMAYLQDKLQGDRARRDSCQKLVDNNIKEAYTVRWGSIA